MKKVYKSIFEILKIAVGGFIFAVSFNVFVAPNSIAPGGLNGLALIVNHLFNYLPVGVLYLIFNIPMFFISFRHIGGEFFKNSIIGAVLLSIFIDLTAFMPQYTDDRLIAAVFGGLICGAGLGIIFLSNASTGGSDILSRVLNRRFQSIKIGRFILMSDAVIVALAAVIFKNVNTALYSAVFIYISSMAVDMVIYGTETAKVAYIISAEYENISAEISQRLGRGGSFLDITGSYTGNKQNMIMCAVKRSQMGTLKQIVDKYDKNAFFIIVNAHEVIGEGFEKRL